jgi:hypothetical protein
MLPHLTITQVAGIAGACLLVGVCVFLVRARQAVRIEEPPAEPVLWLTDERRDGDG